MPAPHPRMHGATHVRGGPDPIPDAGVTNGAQVFAAAMTTIAAGVSANMTFGTDSGDALTTAYSGNVRAFAAAGLYAVDANVYVNSLTAGYALNLEITLAGRSAILTATAGTGTTSTFAGRTGVFEVGAGHLLTISVRNGDTTSRNFNMYCAITQLA